ncbi:hypothetical protein FD754_011145 [Muntiacus muntjak]|uniref:Apolipoprotein L3 n=1 Tax=Muntiacus muntjak TaxID=9888 RepID=A0A5N3VB29_MUNMU|nr:hypothetical protein FD754_011145 [Muntiacus muntjak]
MNSWRELRLRPLCPGNLPTSWWDPGFSPAQLLGLPTPGSDPGVRVKQRVQVGGVVGSPLSGGWGAFLPSLIGSPHAGLEGPGYSLLQRRRKFPTSHRAESGQVSQSKLPLGEAEELHKYLDELKRALVEESQERVPKEQLDRRRFLIKFPRVKRQLEEFIGKFHELADKVDKVHKGCTISNVMAHSTGAVSSILTIVGLALASVTAGASVVLLATGIGLGAAAAVTHVSTSIIEHVKRSSAETEASHMMSSVVKKWKVLLEVLKSNPHIVDTTEKVTEAVQCIEMNIYAMETGKANPGSQIEAGFKATALTITKGVQIAGLATAGVFLLVDVGFLVKESKHLHDGAKTVAAESLRQRAWELERKLEELTQIYENLQEDLI